MVETILFIQSDGGIFNPVRMRLLSILFDPFPEKFSPSPISELNFNEDICPPRARKTPPYSYHYWRTAHVNHPSRNLEDRKKMGR